jgi:nitric oxide reductase large subunit
MTQQQLKEYCDRKGYDSRKYRFMAISDILGVTPEEAKAVEQITRYFRELFPIDEVGMQKEQEWRKPEWMWQMENQQKIGQQQLTI